MVQHVELLRRGLRINAAFSGVSGAAFAAWPGWWSERFGAVEPLIPALIGVGLLLFAGLVAWTSADLRRRRTLVPWIVVADALWVVATPVVMVLGAAVIQPAGHLLLAAVALAVAALGALQWHGYRHWRT